ncbi:glucosaminidase domain-containing protein [Kiloniella laminariae]|uniref:Glucosaminidase domain-containing protein n=1 Tax=Kiloniella laminariae TaxID=454162 RepID=A0ABT4LLP8_9PROT|nr:glucosaminidase domain-containing protein [Kiloniella laminariae]MCZ4281296.1 glucosaminidase domain-containing protein [Kiloniella laminariae]
MKKYSSLHRIVFWLLTGGVCFVVAALLIPEPRRAQFFPSGISLDSRESMLSLFQAHEYHLVDVRNRKLSVPRLFIDRFPDDFGNEPDVEVRKSLFIRSLLPLVLRVNEKVLRERDKLIAFTNRLELVDNKSETTEFSTDEIAWLSGLAERYRVANVLRDGHIDPVKLARLTKRVDVVPVSLILAQAIQESGWGTSRFVREGNALFGQRIWVENGTGLVPQDRGEEESFRVRSFDSLLGSVEAYVHNLNSHVSYSQFRSRRWQLRRAGANLDGRLDGPGLAMSLTAYSEEGSKYVAALQSVMSSNKLQDFDQAKLVSDDVILSGSVDFSPLAFLSPKG